MTDLQITPFTLGPLQTNCYVLTAGGECWVVDAGADPQAMLDHLADHGLAAASLLLTHAHADHIAGVATLREAYPGLPILIHPAERDFPGDVSLNLSLYVGTPIVAPDPTGTFDHGDTLHLAGLPFEVRHTPGHSPGGVTLYQRDHGVALVGDTLFAGSIGRFDFPTSDGRALIRSIHEQLLTLPDDTRVLPGHGPETTVGRERAGNPYLREVALG